MEIHIMEKLLEMKFGNKYSKDGNACRRGSFNHPFQLALMVAPCASNAIWSFIVLRVEQ